MCYKNLLTDNLTLLFKAFLLKPVESEVTDDSMLGNLDSYMQKKKTKLDHQLTPYTKINSRWIKGLNMSCDTIKVLEKNMGRKISDIPCSYIFTNMCPRAKDIKERINKWDYMKIKKLLHS